MVCDAMLYMDQAGGDDGWVNMFFGGSWKKYEKFVKKHRQEKEWTDTFGILCQATALYLRQEIHIVGTVNFGQRVPFTRLESGSASTNPPLTIGHYYDQHFVSLTNRRETPEAVSPGTENNSRESLETTHEDFPRRASNIERLSYLRNQKTQKRRLSDQENVARKEQRMSPEEVSAEAEFDIAEVEVEIAEVGVDGDGHQRQHGGEQAEVQLSLIHI